VTGVEEEVEAEASLPSWAEAGAAARASTAEERWWWWRRRRPSPHAAAAAAAALVVVVVGVLLLAPMLLLHTGRARHGLMDPVPSANRRLGAHGARPPPARTFIVLVFGGGGGVVASLFCAREERKVGDGMARVFGKGGADRSGARGSTL
jgi:hypothetical protein